MDALNGMNCRRNERHIKNKNPAPWSGKESGSIENPGAHISVCPGEKKCLGAGLFSLFVILRG
jgi:hypothetical protein